MSENRLRRFSHVIRKDKLEVVRTVIKMNVKVEVKEVKKEENRKINCWM